MRTIKRAQELLGKLHDLQVLQAHVAAVEADPGAGRAAPGARGDSGRIEDQCRRLHGRYVAQSAALRVLGETVRSQGDRAAARAAGASTQDGPEANPEGGEQDPGARPTRFDQGGIP